MDPIGVGDRILGRYEVLAELGRGGMGRVFRVRHLSWQFDLALKVPVGSLRSRAEIEAFEHECRLWMDLGFHPHVAFCEYVRVVRGTPLVFCELAEGGTLRDRIDDGALYAGGPAAALSRVLRGARELAAGLGYAHSRGVVHLDVKPANALLAASGACKLTDFGIARAIPGQTRGSAAAPSSASLTPAYCSPEQKNGLPLTPASDVWSWGASVVEMFLGDRPWEWGVVLGAALEEYLQDLDSFRVPPPEGLVSLLRRCFHQDPRARPDVSEILHELQQASPVAPALSATVPASRRRVLLNTYEVLEKVRHDNMGDYYRVRHLRWDRELAMLELPSYVPAEEATRITAEFCRMCDIWMSLGVHPHVLFCHHVRHIDGAPHAFLEREAMESRDLVQAAGPGGLTLPEALDVGIQLAWALEFVHRSGIAHLDVKPAHVFIDRRDTIRLGGFRMAQRGEASAEGDVVVPTTLGYTLLYMSPEQARTMEFAPGEVLDAAHRLTSRSDVWSWGATVLKLAAGRSYENFRHGADRDDLLRSIVALAEGCDIFAPYLSSENAEPEARPLPASLKAVLRRALEPDPGRRASLSSLAQGLADVYVQTVGRPYPRVHPGGYITRWDR